MILLYVWLVIVHQIANISSRTLKINGSEEHSKGHVAHFLVPLIGSDVKKEGVKVQVVPYHDKNIEKDKRFKKPVNNIRHIVSEKEDLDLAALLAEPKFKKAVKKITSGDSNESIEIKHVGVKGKNNFWKKLDDKASKDESQSDNSDESSIFIQVKRNKQEDVFKNLNAKHKKDEANPKDGYENSENSISKDDMKAYNHNKIKGDKKNGEDGHYQYHSEECESNENLFIEDRNFPHQKHSTHHKGAPIQVKIVNLQSSEKLDKNKKNKAKHTDQKDKHHKNRSESLGDELTTKISVAKHEHSKPRATRVSRDHVSTSSEASDITKTTEELSKSHKEIVTEHQKGQIHQKYLWEEVPNEPIESLHKHLKDYIDPDHDQHVTKHYYLEEPISGANDIEIDKKVSQETYEKSLSDKELLKHKKYHDHSYELSKYSSEFSSSKESTSQKLKKDHMQDKHMYENPEQDNLHDANSEVAKKEDDTYNSYNNKHQQHHYLSNANTESLDGLKSSKEVVTIDPYHLSHIKSSDHEYVSTLLNPDQIKIKNFESLDDSKSNENKIIVKDTNHYYSQSQKDDKHGFTFRNAEKSNVLDELNVPVAEHNLHGNLHHRDKQIVSFITDNISNNDHKEHVNKNQHKDGAKEHDTSLSSSNDKSMINYNEDVSKFVNEYDSAQENKNAEIEDIRNSEELSDEVMTETTEIIGKTEDISNSMISEVSKVRSNINEPHLLLANNEESSKNYNKNDDSKIIFLKGGKLKSHAAPLDKFNPEFHTSIILSKNPETLYSPEVIKSGDKHEDDSSLKPIKNEETNSMEEEFIIAEVNYHKTYSDENEGDKTDKQLVETNTKNAEEKSKKRSAEVIKNKHSVHPEDTLKLKYIEKQILDVIASYAQERAHLEAKKNDRKKSYNLSFLFNRR